MKIVRNREGSVSILEISAAQFGLVVDALNDVNRADNPCRPFGEDFQGLIDRLRLELAKGAELFTIEQGPGGAVYRCPVLARQVAAAIAKARGKPRCGVPLSGARSAGCCSHCQSPGQTSVPVDGVAVAVTGGMLQS